MLCGVGSCDVPGDFSYFRAGFRVLCKGNERICLTPSTAYPGNSMKNRLFTITV